MAISPVVKTIASKIWIWTKVLLRFFFFNEMLSLKFDRGEGKGI